MIRRFLLWLTARLPVKVIGRGSPFVEWYYLGTPFGLFRVQIHRFLRSDPDGLHDHPWGWARTFILTGWYLEERRDTIRVRTAGDTYALTGDTFHRVVLPIGAREVWTLFIHGPYVKHWGFLQPHRMLLPQREGPSWSDPFGGLWEYQARPKHGHRFENWHLTAPKGRDIRESA